MKSTVTVVVAFVIALCMGSSVEAQQPVSIASEVEALLKGFDVALNAMDLEATMAHYADEVVVLPPDGLAVVGKPAVRRWTEDAFSGFTLKETHHPGETLQFGEIILHRGDATRSMTPNDGGAPIVFNNKYIHVFRRGDDGRLRLLWCMFNSNPAAP